MADIGRNIDLLNELDAIISSADESGKIDLSKYLMSVTSKSLPKNELNSTILRLHMEIAEIEVDSNRAQSLAIIVNEFITNTLKHAGDSTVELDITLRRENERAVLELKDSGPGLPENLVEGLGMRIIAAMCGSIKASCSWPRGSGTCLRIEFRIDV